jgi:hypothetical protein
MEGRNGYALINRPRPRLLQASRPWGPGDGAAAIRVLIGGAPSPRKRVPPP